ncbi:MAG: glycosyltransferase [Clostridium sp.]|jgi:glycosyltransferase involved in cell wall biosynthesis|nr:glycosyltransferase [Clostridium sp.]
MNEIPLISVIVPVYNLENYLERCVQSLCTQSYTNLEIILINDGSTDGSSELCRRLAKSDKRIQVYTQTNTGPSGARNFGMHLARGQFIGFVDGDDYIEPKQYEYLYQALCDYPVSIAQIGRVEETTQGLRLDDICVPPKETQVMEHEAFLRELLMHRGDCSFCTKLFDRAVLAGKLFPQGCLNEDFRLLVEILAQGVDVVSLPQQTYHVIYREDSNTRNKENNRFSRVFEDGVDNADLVMGIVKEKSPALTKHALRFGAYQRLEYLLHIPIPLMVRNNAFYRKVCRWCRKNLIMSMCNRFLTAKQKCYILLLAIAPKTIRRYHNFLMNKRRLHAKIEP